MDGVGSKLGNVPFCSDGYQNRPSPRLNGGQGRYSRVEKKKGNVGEKKDTVQTRHTYWIGESSSRSISSASSSCCRGQVGVLERHGTRRRRSFHGGSGRLKGVERGLGCGGREGWEGRRRRFTRWGQAAEDMFGERLLRKWHGGTRKDPRLFGVRSFIVIKAMPLEPIIYTVEGTINLALEGGHDKGPRGFAQRP